MVQYGLLTILLQQLKSGNSLEKNNSHTYKIIGTLTTRGCSRWGACLLYTSDAADEEDSVDLGGRRIIKKKKK